MFEYIALIIIYIYLINCITQIYTNIHAKIIKCLLKLYYKNATVSDSIKEKCSFRWFIDRFLESAELARFYLGDLRA